MPLVTSLLTMVRKEGLGRSQKKINSYKMNRKLIGKLNVWGRRDDSVIKVITVQTSRPVFKHPCQNEAWQHLLLSSTEEAETGRSLRRTV